MENNFWKNRINDTTELSVKLNVDEEKIKELKDGKRIIEGETLEEQQEKIDCKIKPLSKQVKPIKGDEIVELKSEITRLKTQLSRYEKLIDLIKEND